MAYSLQCDMLISIFSIFSFNFVLVNVTLGFPWSSFKISASFHDTSNLSSSSSDIALNIASFAANLPA